MAYESDAEPIKMGYLMDFRLPDGFPEEHRADLTDPFDHVFQEGLEQGVIDRPVEILYREVEGLPKGSVKAVIDAYGELVDEGCLLVFGPSITDNAEPTKEAIEERFRSRRSASPVRSSGSGEWTFSLSMGSMSDEPIFWADLIAKRGIDNVGVLVEQSLVGESYIQQFRRACRTKGIRIVAEEQIPQTAKDVTEQVQAAARRRRRLGRPLRVRVRRGARRLRHGGARLGPAPVHGHVLPERLAQRDRVERDARMDRHRPVRPGQPGRPGVPRPLRRALRPAARVVRPRGQPRPRRRPAAGVRRCPPAVAGGGPRRARAGEDVPRGIGRARHPHLVRPYMHRGWMGPGYLVARQLDPDGVTAHTVDRFGDA